MDSEGIIPECLRSAVENWKEQLAARGIEGNFNAPKLLYTIPTGQNPTGVVVSLERKKAIYAVSNTEYDLTFCTCCFVATRQIRKSTN